MLDCLTSQKQASVSQGRICSDNFTCGHTEIQVAHQTFYLIQSQYADTGPTSPSADPMTTGAWQGSHWSVNFLSHRYDSTRKKIPTQEGFEPRIFRSRGERLNHYPSNAVWQEEQGRKLSSQARRDVCGKPVVRRPPRERETLRSNPAQVLLVGCLLALRLSNMRILPATYILVSPAILLFAWRLYGQCWDWSARRQYTVIAIEVRSATSVSLWQHV